jgi:AcrR family transcriptional regulator
MAKSAGAGGRRNPRQVPRNDADRIIEAALALVATGGWRHLSLSAVAAAAEVPIAQIYRLFGSKQAILCGLYRRIDEAVLSDPPQAEAGEHARDRLFDLLMRRFDALRPYKPAIEVLRRELVTDPLAAVCAGGSLMRSMGWMLAAADIANSGMRGSIAVKLTAAAYLSTMRVWRGDDSADLGRTMAVLDARLRRIERWLIPLHRQQDDEAPLPA